MSQTSFTVRFFDKLKSHHTTVWLRFCALFGQKSPRFKLLCTENAESADGFLLLNRQSGCRLATAKKGKAAAKSSFRHIVFDSPRLMAAARLIKAEKPLIKQKKHYI